METVVQFAGGLKFEVVTRGHRVVCDQPTDNGGADSGMSPPEFLLASLGTCAGYYAAQYLKARSLPAEGLVVRVAAEKELKPARLSGFKILVEAPGIEDERHREGLMRAVKSCLIHNTLMQPPHIEIELRAPVAAV